MPEASIDIEELRAAASRAGQLLRALGNESRLMVLCQLCGGERSVGELQRVVGLGQSPLSQHLARLRRDGLVKTRRESQTIYYSLAGTEAARVIETLYDLYCASAESESGN